MILAEAQRWRWCCSSIVALSVLTTALASAGEPASHELATVTGAAAKLACSSVFVAGLSMSQAAHDVEELLRPMSHELIYDMDLAGKRMSASSADVTRTAMFRPGLGCTLVVDSDMAALRQQGAGVPERLARSVNQEWPAGDRVDLSRRSPQIDRAALDHAMDAALFDENPAGEIDTRALVVVHRGRIVAERYAAGFSKETRFLGWSASKSVTGALIGTLVTDGKLSLDQAAPVPAWRAMNDPRRAITLRHLLNMSSGLDFGEGNYAPGDDSTVMLFERGDMARYVEGKLLAHVAGSVFQYSSGTTNLLARIYLEGSGGTVAASEAHAWRRLFKPAGMTSAIFERDASGTVVGSSYFYATARDWARFGLLHLNRGEINGHRILAPEWVDFVRSPAPTDDIYGGQFWLNDAKDDASGERHIAGLPADAYFARGHNSQIVAIVPSRDAVIVRLGWTRGAGRFDMSRHLSAILAALGAPQESAR